VQKVIEDEKRRFPDKMIYLKGDSRGTYGFVRETMETINKVGIEDIMLGVDEIKTLGGAAAGGAH
jgi:biopolymer transport protein ExbD